MTKAEILYELNLKELIGTSFEDMIVISGMKVGEYNAHNNIATYIIDGHVQHIVYTPEGGSFYMDFFGGEVTGINFTFFNRMAGKSKRFDVDILAKKSSKIAYLPFEKLMDLRFDGKSKAIEKLLMMGVREHFEKSKYLLLKNMCSDEEFFIKHLERYKTINIRGTKELSELLNIKQRSLQRFLKRLQEQGVIDRSCGRIQIKDQAKLEEYKRRFEK